MFNRSFQVRTKRTFPALCLGVPILVTAAARTADAQTVRDSAGITIVENPAVDTTKVAFRIGAPLFRLIADSVGGERELFMTHLIRLSDGRFVTNDVDGGRLRFYDSSGRLLRVADAPQDPVTGGRILITAIVRGRGDSVIATRDLVRPPLLFDARGELARALIPQRRPVTIATTARMRATDGRRGLGGRGASAYVVRDPALEVDHFPSRDRLEQVRGMFVDGTLAVAGPTLPSAPSPNADRRAPTLYLRYSSDGERVIDTIGTFLGNDPPYSYETGNPPGSGAPVIATLPLPGLRRTSVVVDGDRVIVGEGTTFELRVYTPSGRVSRIIRSAVPPRPFTNTDMVRLMGTLSTGLDITGRERLGAAIARVTLPKSYAAYGRVEVDDSRRIWVETLPLEGVSPSWTVFDPAGRLLGTVTLPVRGRVIWIGDGAIAVMAGVAGAGSEIVVYRLDR